MSENLILFYHEDSPACKKLLSNLPQDKNIQLVNINQVPQMPPGITSIPALLINNQKVLQGKEVFDYLHANNEMDSFTFNCKTSYGIVFTDLNNDNTESNTNYSSINTPSMNEGVPQWLESDSKSTIDLDKLQKERQELVKKYSPDTNN